MTRVDVTGYSCVLLVVLSVSAQVKEDTFIAAVYEHDVILPSQTMEPTSRRKAVQEMMKNLNVYGTAAASAAKKDAEIIVFPEDGIYGMLWLGSNLRDLIRPFLEYIPEPTARWNPCLDPDRYPDSDVQVMLSCLARNNSIYMVANFGDVQSCNKTDPACPSDGRYQFNTDVAYDPKGNFLAKYHKKHLFAESQFDKPTKPDMVTFDTPFGRFGLITCFDVLFKTPIVDLIRNLSVANIAFPTAWGDAAPFLTAIGFHSSVASAFGINFLAANIHKPLFRFQGSGIYTPRGASTYYYDTGLLSGGKLLVKEIPVLKKPFMSVEKQEAPAVTGVWTQTFSAKIYHDKYTLVRLDEQSTQAAVCQKTLCCNITYEMTSESNLFGQSSDFFALGAFDGLHIDAENYYFQICTVVRCKSSWGNISCGTSIHENNRRSIKTTQTLKTFKIFGNFSTPYIFPEILVTGKRGINLTSYPNTWSYKRGYLTVDKPLSLPLYTAALVARAYDKDKFSSWY